MPHFSCHSSTLSAKTVDTGYRQVKAKEKRTCSWCDSILRGLHCKNKESKEKAVFISEWLIEVFHVRHKQPRGYHLMVYLRLGWLTVLSSRNMVEHELYFRLTGPGWCCGHTHTHTDGHIYRPTYINFYLCPSQKQPKGLLTDRECRTPESSQTNSVCVPSASDVVTCKDGVYGVVHSFLEEPNFNFSFISNHKKIPFLYRNYSPGKQKIAKWTKPA